VNNQLRRLEEYLDRLLDIRSRGKEALLGDDLLRGAAERYLQIAIETVLNIGNHIIAVRGLRLPEDYADIFRILGEAGIVDASLVPRFVEMAKFRNRLVHLYWEMQKEQVWKILEDDLGDIAAFQSLVLSLLKEE
jgi:uncharacterized protein YutE (UPF0331/DUF86 family)